MKKRITFALSAGVALRDRLGMPRPAGEIPDHEKIIADLKKALSEEAFTAAWEAGKTMTLEQAIRDALSETDM